MTNINYVIDSIFVIPDEIREQKGFENLHMIQMVLSNGIEHPCPNYYHAEKLAKECRIGGFNDWRIPCANEIELLFNSNVMAMVNKNEVLENDFDSERGGSIAWIWSSTKSHYNPCDNVVFKIFMHSENHRKEYKIESLYYIEQRTSNRMMGHCFFFLVR